MKKHLSLYLRRRKYILNRYSRNWKINNNVENCFSTVAYCAYCGLTFIMVK